MVPKSMWYMLLGLVASLGVVNGIRGPNEYTRMAPKPLDLTVEEAKGCAKQIEGVLDGLVAYPIGLEGKIQRMYGQCVLKKTAEEVEEQQKLGEDVCRSMYNRSAMHIAIRAYCKLRLSERKVETDLGYMAVVLLRGQVEMGNIVKEAEGIPRSRTGDAMMEQMVGLLRGSYEHLIPLVYASLEEQVGRHDITDLDVQRRMALQRYEKGLLQQAYEMVLSTKGIDVERMRCMGLVLTQAGLILQTQRVKKALSGERRWVWGEMVGLVVKAKKMLLKMQPEGTLQKTWNAREWLLEKHTVVDPKENRGIERIFHAVCALLFRVHRMWGVDLGADGVKEEMEKVRKLRHMEGSTVDRATSLSLNEMPGSAKGEGTEGGMEAEVWLRGVVHMVLEASGRPVWEEWCPEDWAGYSGLRHADPKWQTRSAYPTTKVSYEKCMKNERRTVPAECGHFVEGRTFSAHESPLRPFATLVPWMLRRGTMSKAWRMGGAMENRRQSSIHHQDGHQARPLPQVVAGKREEPQLLEDLKAAYGQMPERLINGTTYDGLCEGPKRLKLAEDFCRGRKRAKVILKNGLGYSQAFDLINRRAIRVVERISRLVLLARYPLVLGTWRPHDSVVEAGREGKGLRHWWDAIVREGIVEFMHLLREMSVIKPTLLKGWERRVGDLLVSLTIMEEMRDYVREGEPIHQGFWKMTIFTKANVRARENKALGAGRATSLREWWQWMRHSISSRRKPKKEVFDRAQAWVMGTENPQSGGDKRLLENYLRWNVVLRRMLRPKVKKGTK